MSSLNSPLKVSKRSSEDKAITSVVDDEMDDFDAEEFQEKLQEL